MTCPVCGLRLSAAGLKAATCENCDTDVRVATAFERRLALYASGLTILLGGVTYSSTSSGTWILALSILGIVLFLIFNFIGMGLGFFFGYAGRIAPVYERGTLMPRLTFFGSVFSAAVTVFVVEFVGFGFLAVFVGASRRELAEHLETLSLPLAWLSPNFLITPKRTFLDVCGIIVGNSFFLGTILFACAKAVRAALARNRVTQINLGGKNPLDDEDNN